MKKSALIFSCLLVSLNLQANSPLQKFSLQHSGVRSSIVNEASADFSGSWTGQCEGYSDAVKLQIEQTKTKFNMTIMMTQDGKQEEVSLKFPIKKFNTASKYSAQGMKHKLNFAYPDENLMELISFNLNFHENENRSGWSSELFDSSLELKNGKLYVYDGAVSDRKKAICTFSKD